MDILEGVKIIMNKNSKRVPLAQTMDNIIPEIKVIMDKWYELSSTQEDTGCSVIGAGMNFTYKGVDYHMVPCSPHQGEGSWTPFIDDIKAMLEGIGATDIEYRYGFMD